MKRKAIVVGVILLLGASVFITAANAQTITPVSGRLSRSVVWSENFDSYAAGTQLGGQGGWHPWGDDPSANANVTNAQSRSPANSVDIYGTSDMVHEWTDINYHNCTFSAWVYVPADFEGQNYLILLSVYAGDSSKWDLQIYFNSETLTLRDYDSNNETPYNPGEWGHIRVEIDFINDWQHVYYNDVLWLSKGWTNGTSGGGILEFGAIDLYANGASTVYWDDLSIWATQAPPTPKLTIGTIAGGFGVKTSINNTGAGTATNVKWTIALDGKLVFVGKSSTGTIASLAAGTGEAIKSGFIFGILKTNIVVSATCDEGKNTTKSATAFVLGPFILGVK
jgi:hypothetical protein